MSRLSNLYLLAYNSLQFLGWAISLFSVLRGFILTKSFNGAYASSGDIVSLLLAASFLEVLHGAIGIVRSGVLLPLMQLSGRAQLFFIIVRPIVEIQGLPSVFITIVAWSLSELIRYSHYALSYLGICPSWLTYLRYTAFIVLYPIGVFPGEMWLMYEALSFIKKKGLYANFFGGLPFSFDSSVKVLLVCYPFMWLKLYLHLFKQRRLKLKNLHHKKEA